jgi:hypothetical protein
MDISIRKRKNASIAKPKQAAKKTKSAGAKAKKKSVTKIPEHQKERKNSIFYAACRYNAEITKMIKWYNDVSKSDIIIYFKSDSIELYGSDSEQTTFCWLHIHSAMFDRIECKKDSIEAMGPICIEISTLMEVFNSIQKEDWFCIYINGDNTAMPKIHVISDNVSVDIPMKENSIEYMQYPGRKDLSEMLKATVEMDREVLREVVERLEKLKTVRLQLSFNNENLNFSSRSVVKGQRQVSVSREKMNSIEIIDNSYSVVVSKTAMGLLKNTSAIAASNKSVFVEKDMLLDFYESNVIADYNIKSTANDETCLQIIFVLPTQATTDEFNN